MGISSTRYEPEIHRKRDGLMMVRADSTIRWLGFWEGLRWRLFGEFPSDCLKATTRPARGG